MAAQPGGQLSAQLAGALALSAAAFPPGQVEGARARLSAAASLLVVGVEAAGRRRAREAGRGAAATEAAPSPATTVLVARGRGADGTLQRGGAARRGARAAVVVRRARQAADAHPGAPVLGRGAVVEGGAAGTMHQLSEACQEV